MPIAHKKRFIGERSIYLTGPVTDYPLGAAGVIGDILRDVNLIKIGAIAGPVTIKDGVLGPYQLAGAQPIVYGMAWELTPIEACFDMRSKNGGWSISLGGGWNAFITGVFTG